MRNFLPILLLLSCLLLSCDSDDGLAQEQELENLNFLVKEFKDMTSGLACEDTNDWSFTSYGSKACGGPIGYMAYSKTIDVMLFLERVEAHRAKQKAFNQKWGIVSDCSIPAAPKGVLCVDGLPVLDF